ncbi:MAG: hypothetical protein V4685_13505 [Bacteroidota bacterium]
MQQESIVHFVGFITDMNTEEFAAEWDGYAQTLKINKTKAVLYKQIKAGKNSYGYIAKFELPEEDFQLPSINERKPSSVSESRIRALQLGGYTAVKQEQVYNNRDNNTTIITFVQHNENDMVYYRDLPLYSQLSIHQAYYENSNYGYIMEFIVPEQDAETLLQHIEKRHLATAGLYSVTLQNKRNRLATSI